MITLPRRVGHRVSGRGVPMVQLELKDGSRVWSVDYYNEAQRQAEADGWRRQEERAWKIPPERWARWKHQEKTRQLIADVTRILDAT